MKRRKGRKHPRKRVFGTPERPRLCVFRSCKHIYAQIIDDTKGHTLCAHSTLGMKGGTKTERSFKCGFELGQKALALGIKKVVFDRDGYRYHGRVKALAEGARKAGLEF